jgi:endonuclease YncB( thermonuclease family)
MFHVLSAARALAVALVLVPMVLAPACAASGPDATVISVGDGDTIPAWINGKPITVRLACIDALETSQRAYSQNVRQILQLRMQSAVI